MNDRALYRDGWGYLWVEVAPDQFIVWNDRTDDYDPWRQSRSRRYIERCYKSLELVAA